MVTRRAGGAASGVRFSPPRPMKLVSLNTWGGKVYKPLLTFIKKHSTDTDIFCFQEVFHTTTEKSGQSGFTLNLYSTIAKILNTHQGYFAPTLDNYITGSFQTHFVDFNLSWGLAIFISKKLKVIYHKDLFIYGKRDSFNPKDLNSLPRNIQYINFISENKEFIVYNIHGIWIKGGKEDTPSKIQQSKQINALLNQQKGGKILCGDFNLAPNTKSVLILEKSLENLIKKYNIQTTRNKYFPGDEKFADYTFVSKEVKVKDFEVPQVEISDHLPMLLQFS